MSLRRGLFGLVAAAALVAARGTALAVCNVAGACSFASVAGCCDATSCTLDGTIAISGPVCDIDFGPRNVTLTSTGTILLGSNTLSIEAGSLTVAGTVNGRGSSPNHGGRLVVTTNGGTANAFRLTGSAALIDLSGFADGGGSLEVHADGPIGILGGKILASQLEPNASGGSILIDTTAGAITVSAPIRAEAGLNGVGGLIDLSAATDLTITDTALVSAASGAGFGGEIDLEANGAFTVAAAASVQATSLTNSAGDGGEINITAGSIAIQGYLEAKGGSDTTGTSGGSGGSINLEADTGALVLSGNQGVVTDGAGGGDGGEIVLLTQSPLAGALQIAATLSASGAGGVAERPAGGGEIDATSAANLTITKKIFVTGGGGATGAVELFGQQDVVIENTIDGSDPVGGGSLDVGSGHDIVVTNAGFDTPIRMNATTNGDGGSINLAAGNDLILGTPPPTSNAVVLTVAGAGPGAGRYITLTAGRNLTIRKNVTLTANTPLTSTREGGQISIAAGFPDLTGALQIDGQVTAKGRAASAVPAPATIGLSGCQVTISSTGTVDSSGDATAFNTVTARQGIAIAGHLTTTASGQNLIAYPSGVTVPSGSSVSPPFTCSGTCPKPLCTQLSPPAPAGCLVPCPDCPNTADPTNGQFPEQCGTPGCPNCDLHCRHFGPSGCDDGLPCTTDRCDTATFGYPTCVDDPKPSGTSCDDATVCNGREVCEFQAGFSVCAAGTALDCDDGNPCTADACDALNGCSTTPISGKGIGGCDDGCVERCSSGTCVPITPPNCDDHDPNTIDSCNKNDCTAPGDPSCCAHAPAPSCASDAQCADANPCTSDTCSSGKCHNDPVTDGTPCADGDICNGDETCRSGVCTLGTPLDCDDGKPCTDDTCDPVTGCANTPIPNCCVSVTDCNDQNHCTNDACVDGRCQHVLDPDCCDTDAGCDDSNPCTTDMCVNQRCSRVPVANGPHAGCGDACTSNPQCQSGTCVAPPITCPDDGDICTEDFCDPAQGCVHPAIEGCCHTNADCDDRNICTGDVCDPDRHICINTPRFPGCQACASDTDCDPLGACGQRICCTSVADGTPCSVVAGVCSDETYAPPDCNDGNTKTQDACVVDGPGHAHCDHLCLCDDHNVCNGTETCGQNVCNAGTPLDCDDGDDCTDDGCDPVRGCTHGAVTGYACVARRLDAIALRLNQAAGAAITPSVRAKLSKLVGKARGKLAAAQGASGKRVLKNLKAAGGALKAITNAAAAARRKHRIDGALADAITAAAQRAAAVIEKLKTGLTPA